MSVAYFCLIVAQYFSREIVNSVCKQNHYIKSMILLDIYQTSNEDHTKTSRDVCFGFQDMLRSLLYLNALI